MTTTTKAEENQIGLMYDTKNRKVGCVLLQAIFGCPSNPCFWWDSDCWETGDPTNLKPLRGTVEQWKRLAALDNANLAARKVSP